jgi:DNA repair exonuclease SbcCD ATPase subunit
MRLFAMLTFIFLQALALSKARIAEKASEAVERSRVTELEKTNATLRAELDQARAKNSEVEDRENRLKANYDRLNSDYKNLEADAEKSHDAQVAEIRNRFQKFHMHFHQRLRDLRYESEGALGELGGRCLEYLEPRNTIGTVTDWFMGEIKALPLTLAEANKNIVCFAVAGILRML